MWIRQRGGRREVSSVSSLCQCGVYFTPQKDFSRSLLKALHALSETQAVMYVTLQIESYFKSLARTNLNNRL